METHRTITINVWSKHAIIGIRRCCSCQSITFTGVDVWVAVGAVSADEGLGRCSYVASSAREWFVCVVCGTITANALPCLRSNDTFCAFKSSRPPSRPHSSSRIQCSSIFIIHRVLTIAQVTVKIQNNHEHKKCHWKQVLTTDY